MGTKHVIAIIQECCLNDVLEAFRENDVPGVSVANVKGYGEYRNTYSKDSLVESVRLDVFVNDDRVDTVANLVFEHANNGLEGSGVVAISPLDVVYRVRDQQVIEG